MPQKPFLIKALIGVGIVSGGTIATIIGVQTYAVLTDNEKFE